METKNKSNYYHEHRISYDLVYQSMRTMDTDSAIKEINELRELAIKNGEDYYYSACWEKGEFSLTREWVDEFERPHFYIAKVSKKN